jgi:hypothetical protein
VEKREGEGGVRLEAEETRVESESKCFLSGFRLKRFANCAAEREGELGRGGQ